MALGGGGTGLVLFAEMEEEGGRSVIGSVLPASHWSMRSRLFAGAGLNAAVRAEPPANSEPAPRRECKKRASVHVCRIRPIPASAQAASGAPGEDRTPDLLVRSQPLYPPELRARLESSITQIEV